MVAHRRRPKRFLPMSFHFGSITFDLPYLTRVSCFVSIVPSVRWEALEQGVQGDSQSCEPMGDVGLRKTVGSTLNSWELAKEIYPAMGVTGVCTRRGLLQFFFMQIVQNTHIVLYNLLLKGHTRLVWSSLAGHHEKCLHRGWAWQFPRICNVLWY